MRPIVYLVLLALIGISFGEARRAVAADTEKNVSKVPRILIIGDSISIGYMPFVQEMMKDQAIVIHPPGNCEATVVGLSKLDDWLGNTQWDVIHFNWGLHDLKYVKDKEGTATEIDKGERWVPVDVYEKNLDELAARLEKTGAKLIWCTTTTLFPRVRKAAWRAMKSNTNEAAARG